MKLRALEEKDAPLMLEWMHDEDATKDLRNDFRPKKLECCPSSIKNCKNKEYNDHLAICNDD